LGNKNLTWEGEKNTVENMQMSKRNFIKATLLSSASVLVSCKLNFANKSKTFGEKNMSFELPALPYARNALAPYISENTINFHYGKHHQAYVTNLNNLVASTDLAEKSLEEIIKISATDKTKAGIFNNSAQVWNHTFYWNSMKPNGGGKPAGEVLAKIEADFGSYENFVTEFKNAGATQFGSGWAWLVLDEGKLKITKTGNAETPLTTSAKPLMTMDVWEHAYYLDFQNARPTYIDTFLNHLVNWDFVAANLK
jgi:Fe-Mn family superoxide dismutase